MSAWHRHLANSTS